VLLVGAFALVGGAVAVRINGSSRHAHLSALDRATGARRWRVTLPAAGAMVIVAQGETSLGVSACSSDAGWYDVDRATGTLHTRRWTPADGNPRLVSV
jgi:outer membrane protein assembly factor BamB